MLKKLIPIEREQMVKDYILPCRIKYQSDNIDNSNSLLSKKTLQIALFEDDCMIVNGKSFIVLDFGKEIQGGIRILTYSLSGERCRIRLRFGESISETYQDTMEISETNTATNDHSLRDFHTEISALSDMQFGQTGFRFLRIDFLTDCILKIKSIIGVFEHLDLQRRGSFICSDQRLNDIFETAAYTVELCMRDVIWDGIKRDRLIWIGDMHPEVMSIMSLYGEHRCVERSLSYIRSITPLPGFMNEIPAYSFWWLCIVSDYYMQNGNIDFLKQEKQYITELINYIDSFVGTDGKINLPNDAFMNYFLDWQSADYKEKETGVYALCSYAMQKTKVIFEALNIDKTILDNIIARLYKFGDCGNFKQVRALKVLSGQIDAKNALHEQKEGGAKGLSTFMSYYILSSIAKAGETENAVSIMKEYYGAMLDRGATTFWEDFNMDWLEGSSRIDELPKENEKDLHGDYGAHCYKGFRHSLCHGWSSGAVPFLMHYVLGVKVLDPDCKRVEVKPNLCGLSYLKGIYPTRHGNIEIEVNDINGKTVADIISPEGVTIIR